MVLVALAAHFERLHGQDLATKCKDIPDATRAVVALAGHVGVLAGRYSGADENVPTGTKKSQIEPRLPSAETVWWGVRKLALTAECSSRWAGWITKSSNDGDCLGRRSQLRRSQRRTRR